MPNIRYYFQILMKHEFSGHILENARISNFKKIRPVGSDLVYGNGQADRYDEANSRFSLFCEGV